MKHNKLYKLSDLPSEDKMVGWDIVTGFVKGNLPHTSNILILTIHNFSSEWAIGLKFGQL